MQENELSYAEAIFTLLNNPAMTKIMMRLYTLIWQHVVENNYCSLTNPQLALQLDVSVSIIINSITELENSGYIRKVLVNGNNKNRQLFINLSSTFLSSTNLSSIFLSNRKVLDTPILSSTNLSSTIPSNRNMLDNNVEIPTKSRRDLSKRAENTKNPVIYNNTLNTKTLNQNINSKQKTKNISSKDNGVSSSTETPSASFSENLSRNGGVAKSKAKLSRKEAWRTQVLLLITELEMGGPLAEALAEYVTMLSEMENQKPAYAYRVQFKDLKELVATEAEKIEIVMTTIKRAWMSLDYAMNDFKGKKDKEQGTGGTDFKSMYDAAEKSKANLEKRRQQMNDPNAFKI